MESAGGRTEGGRQMGDLLLLRFVPISTKLADNPQTHDTFAHRPSPNIFCISEYFDCKKTSAPSGRFKMNRHLVPPSRSNTMWMNPGDPQLQRSNQTLHPSECGWHGGWGGGGVGWVGQRGLWGRGGEATRSGMPENCFCDCIQSRPVQGVLPGTSPPALRRT